VSAGLTSVGQLIRSADIVAIKVVPVGSAPDAHGEGFGLTVIG
jgi:hypothetical protein